MKLQSVLSVVAFLCAVSVFAKTQPFLKNVEVKGYSNTQENSKCAATLRLNRSYEIVSAQIQGLVESRIVEMNAEGQAQSQLEGISQNFVMAFQEMSGVQVVKKVTETSSLYEVYVGGRRIRYLEVFFNEDKTPTSVNYQLVETADPQEFVKTGRCTAVAQAGD